MEEAKSDSKDNNGRTSQEDIRELRRQMEDYMVRMNYSPEEINILMHTQPYKATWLIHRLTLFDSNEEKRLRHIAEEILPKDTLGATLTEEERLQCAKALKTVLRTAFIKLMTMDEAPATRAQMPMSARVVYMTETKRRVRWEK